MNAKTELLQKLKALAERGVNGEKANAEVLLNKLMKKYNVSLDELSEDITETIEFKYHGTEQEKILRQVIYKVTNRKDNTHSYSYTYSGRKCRTILGAEVTKAQRIEIEFLFDWFVTQWQTEKQALLEAFIQKHNIFGELQPGECGRELTPAEMAKMSNLIMGMDDVSPVRRLEAKK